MVPSSLGTIEPGDTAITLGATTMATIDINTMTDADIATMLSAVTARREKRGTRLDRSGAQLVTMAVAARADIARIMTHAARLDAAAVKLAVMARAARGLPPVPVPPAVIHGHGARPTSATPPAPTPSVPSGTGPIGLNSPLCHDITISPDGRSMTLCITGRPETSETWSIETLTSHGHYSLASSYVRRHVISWGALTHNPLALRIKTAAAKMAAMTAPVTA